MRKCSEGRFREDLFYRIAVAYLKLPPLRDRPGDLGLLTRPFDRTDQSGKRRNSPGTDVKKISPNAKNVLLNHDWPGNVRELQNTLRRAMVWTDSENSQKTRY